MRAFVRHQLAKWSRYFLLAELCYNTISDSSIKITPCKALFGKPPLSIPSYVPRYSSIVAADDLLRDRDKLLSILRNNLSRAQERMKFHAYKHHSDKVSEVRQ